MEGEFITRQFHVEPKTVFGTTEVEPGLCTVPDADPPG
jgi:hypothetical protein